MATYTYNINLAKPEMTDPASPAMFNNNSDIIDAQIGELNGYKATVNGLVATSATLRTDVDANTDNITILATSIGSISTLLDSINGEVI